MHCSVAVRIPVPDRDNGWDWQIFLPVIHPPFLRNPSFLYPGNTEPGLGFKQGSSRETGALATQIPD